MAIIAFGILATAAIGGGGYYAWRTGHPKDGAAAGAEGAEAGAQPGWRQRLANVRGGAPAEGEEEAAAAEGGKTKDGKDGKKKSRFGMPKMPKVNIPSASDVKMMVAKKQMGL